ncbi:hypothetical protein XANCAGTX0491_003923 [Xanthoria calcicola]
MQQLLTPSARVLQEDKQIEWKFIWDKGVGRDERQRTQALDLQNTTHSHHTDSYCLLSLITAMHSRPPPSEQGDCSGGYRVGPEPVKEKEGQGSTAGDTAEDGDPKSNSGDQYADTAGDGELERALDAADEESISSREDDGTPGRRTTTR